MNAEPAVHPTVFFSIGYRCTPSQLLIDLELKKESYPFDWMITKLNTAEHCIETRFKEFFNVDNYIKIKARTYNFYDGNADLISEEDALVNTFYETEPVLNGLSKYHFNLALTHSDLRVEKERTYYERCVNRFYRMLDSDMHKLYVYNHPLIGVNDYQRSASSLLIDITNFSHFMHEKTNNIYGIFFIMVKGAHTIKRELVAKTYMHEVYVIYVGDALIDTGAPFGGETPACFKREVELMNDIIRGYIKQHSAVPTSLAKQGQEQEQTD